MTNHANAGIRLDKKGLSYWYGKPLRFFMF